MTLTPVTTWYLEMTQPAALNPAKVPSMPVEVKRAEVPSPEFSRFLYTAVGGDWNWTNRLNWDFATWLRYLDRPEVETLVAWVAGTPAGYAEFLKHQDGSVEIVQFGLLPRFIGQGIGGHLLQRTIQRGWEMGAQRVWLHTCSLDGPHALANYRARGLKVFREVTEVLDMPATTPGPWPGAHS